jgi:hypothetical protein
MSPNSHGAMGLWAWVIVALTAALLAAGVCASVVRVRRGVAVALLAAASLLPVIGLAATIVGMFHSMRTIETLDAPTPKDLAAGVHQSTVCFALGFVGLVVCGITGFVALHRSRRPDASPPPGA